MRKLALCLFYGLCTFTIAFSLFSDGPAPAQCPPLPRPEDEADGAAEPRRTGSAGATALYYLCDEGGMLTVYACGADGQPADRLEETGIYVNLLPENDALRIKQGLSVYSETELRTVLEDLGE